MKEKKPKKHYPFPEITQHPDRAEGWDIEAGTGITCLADDKFMMSVPLGANSHALAVRIHEKAHQEWSPFGKSPEVEDVKADRMTIKACEDWRIHFKLIHQCGLEEEILPLSRENVAVLYTDNRLNVRAMLLDMIAALPIKDHFQRFAQAMKERALLAYEDSMNGVVEDYHFLMTTLSQVRQWQKNILEGMKGGGDSVPFLYTKTLSEWIENLLVQHEASQQHGDPEEEASQGEGAPCEQNLLTLNDTDTETPLPFNGSEWAPMLMKYPPLTRMRRKYRSAGVHRGARDTGSIFRYPNRYCVDQAVFREVRPRRGGTVLADVSLSMSLTHDDVERLINAAPSATVAIYCADLGCEKQPGTDKNPYGELTVVAKRGKQAKRIHRMGTHNLIDGPALEWLAKQPEPRIWLTDGIATSVHYRDNGRAYRVIDPKRLKECMEIMSVHRITRVGTIQEAEKVLSAEKES